MDCKRFGKSHTWNKEARFTLHDKDGWGLPVRACARRGDAKREAMKHGVDGTWIKDNINTAFVYQIVRGKIRRLKVSRAKK